MPCKNRAVNDDHSLVVNLRRSSKLEVFLVTMQIALAVFRFVCMLINNNQIIQNRVTKFALKLKFIFYRNFFFDVFRVWSIFIIGKRNFYFY